MIGNSHKIFIFLSIIVLLAILVRCDKPQKPSSPPVIIKKVTQPAATNTPVRKELSEEKPETNWFAAIDGAHGRLAGIFRDAAENPVTNVSAICRKIDKSKSPYKVPPKIKLGFSIEPDGSYLSEPIAPGMYTSTLSAPEYKDNETTFIVRPEDTTLLEICFESYPVVTCTVVDAESEEPVSNAVIAGVARLSQPKGSSWSSPTTAEGTFTVNPRDEPNYLSISHSEYLTEMVGVKNEPQVIRLYRGGDVLAKLVDSGGMLSTNIHTVILYGSHKPYELYSHQIARIICTNGTCIFSNVSPGKAPLKVFVDRGIGEAVLEKLVPGKISEITVDLRPRASLSVNINLPLSNVHCYVTVKPVVRKTLGVEEKYVFKQFAKLNKQTNFTFQSVLTGSYSVIVNISKEYRLSTNVVIKSGKNTELNINEDQFPSGCIRGTFLTTKGKPLTGVVRVYDHGNQSYVGSAPIVTGSFCITALNKQTAYDIDLIPGRSLIAQTNIIVSAVLPDGPGLEIVITDMYSIRGMVVDQNHEILNTTVNLENGFWMSYNGGFELYPLIPGTYKISIQAQGYLPVVEEVTVTDSDIDLGTIELVEGGITISGKIIDPQGMPCQNYYVQLSTVLVDVPPGKPNVSIMAKTDDSGAFTITGVPEDQEFFFAVVGRDAALQKDIGPFYTDTDLGTLSLSPKQYLVVELINNNGQPVKDVYIDYTRVDKNGIWRGKPHVKGILSVSKRRSFTLENPANVFRTRYTITDDPTNHVTIILPDSFNN